MGVIGNLTRGCGVCGIVLLVFAGVAAAAEDDVPVRQGHKVYDLKTRTVGDGEVKTYVEASLPTHLSVHARNDSDHWVLIGSVWLEYQGILAGSFGRGKWVFRDPFEISFYWLKPGASETWSFRLSEVWGNAWKSYPPPQHHVQIYRTQKKKPSDRDIEVFSRKGAFPVK